MNYIEKNKNNLTLILVIIGTIIFFMFVMPLVDNYCFKEKFSELNNKDIVKIDKLQCSKSCCGLNPWLPEELLNKNINSEEMKKYIPSNFSCNYGNGSGCVCIKPIDYNYLSNRGNNSDNSKCNTIN